METSEDWPKLIRDMLAAGETQGKIAEACQYIEPSTGKVCKMSQQMISQLKTGETKQPKKPFGDALVKHHEKVAKNVLDELN